MTRVLIATRSADKAREIRRILAPIKKLELVSLADLGIAQSSDEDTLETAETFLENATAKATYFARTTELPVLADDSGLEVAALGNQPGVRTRRFALDAGLVSLQGMALDRANNELLLQRMENIPSGQRTACYVCAGVLATVDARLSAAIGTCKGEIAKTPRGQSGFGYDPLFLIPELGLTFAELTPDQKDLYSHRARAFRALAAVLEATANHS